MLLRKKYLIYFSSDHCVCTTLKGHRAHDRVRQGMIISRFASLSAVFLEKARTHVCRATLKICTGVVEKRVRKKRARENESDSTHESEWITVTTSNWFFNQKANESRHWPSGNETSVITMIVIYSLQWDEIIKIMNNSCCNDLPSSTVVERVSPSEVSPGRRTFVCVCRARRATAESLDHSICRTDLSIAATCSPSIGHGNRAARTVCCSCRLLPPPLLLLVGFPLAVGTWLQSAAIGSL